MPNYPLKVALVDEAQEFRKALKSNLEKQRGLQVVAEAGDGLSAMRIVEQHQPDILVMALVMPMMHGLVATKQIVAKYPDTKVIILTKYASRDNHDKALRAGASAFITKDCGPRDVYRSILNCVYSDCTYSECGEGSSTETYKQL